MQHPGVNQPFIYLLDKAGDFMVIVDNSGTVQWANKTFVDLFGYSIEDVADLNILTVFREGISWQEILYMAGAPGETDRHFRAELHCSGNDGRTFWVSVDISPVPDDGKVVQFVIVGKDMSSQKSQEVILQQQSQKLDEISFISAHLIRAPLANILGLTDLLISSSDAAENQQIMMYLKESATRLDQVIRRTIH